MSGDVPSSPGPTGVPPSIAADVGTRRLLVTVGVGLALGTAALLADPDVSFATVAPYADAVLNTTNALAAIAVAVLGWTRFLDRRRWNDLLEGAAFVPLALLGLTGALTPVVGWDALLGMNLDDPGQAPLYFGALARITCALVLILAGFLSGRVARLRPGIGPLVFLAPGMAVLAVSAIVVSVGDSLPPLLTTEGLEQLRSNPGLPSALPGRTPLGLSAEVLVAGALLLAAAVLVSRVPSSAGPGRRYVALGLVIAAFGEVHSAIYPGVHSTIVTTGDLLRLSLSLVLLVGLQRDAAADLRRLEQANRELERLARSEALRAAAEERGRLARDLHDGLAQQLWRARLKLGLLLERPHLPRDVEALAGDAVAAVGAALLGAREALRVLRRAEPDGGLAEALEWHARAFASELDLRFSLEVGALPTLTPTDQGELVRIVDEALTNVWKHADATVVRLVAGVHDGRLTVSVIDNGQGFHPGSAHVAAFGLRTMRERADEIGAELTIESGEQQGTAVHVTMPVGTSTGPPRPAS